MKNVLKRTLAIFLTIVMTIGIAPLSGFVGLKFPELKLPDWFDFGKILSVKADAATYSGTCGDNLAWALDTDTGELVITGSGAMTDFSTYSNVPWESYSSYIKSVTLPDGITSIGDRAFSFCDDFTSITIPDSVTSIGDNAFYSCNGLTSITIPDSVTSLGQFAFSYCRGLTTITLSDSLTVVNYSVFRNCTNLTSVIIPDSVTSIGSYSFYSCEKLTSITMPDSVTNISSVAFGRCIGLTSIQLPEGLTRIGESAFVGCTGLTSITIPDNVTSIEESAFEGCTGLTSITIPDSVESIGNGAFADTGVTAFTVEEGNLNFSSDEYGSLYNKDKTKLIQYPICKSETSYTIPDSVTSISPSAFGGCKYLTTITIPDSMTNIGYEAFCDCTSLETITIPDTVITIGWSAFEGCTNLTTITIPDSVTSIDGYTFCNCESLVTITIPDSVTTIGNSAFMYCRGLTSITIPDGVTSIDSSAFYYCTALTTITIPDSVTSIGENAFYGCDSLETVYYLGRVAQWTKLSCDLSSSVTVLCSGKIEETDESSFTYTITNEEITITGYVGDDTEVGIPDTISGYPVVEIGTMAFRNCSNITAVSIPDTVKTIGTYAFNKCYGLCELYLGENIETIGASAFEYCNRITSVTLPENITVLESRVFKNCERIAEIYIPVTVTSISNSAFYGCTALNTINYSGTKSQWQNIEVAENDSTYGDTTYYDAAMVYCSDGSLFGDGTLVDFEYTVDSSSYVTITKYTGASKEVKIPTFIGDYEVAIIGESAFEGRTDITSVDMSEADWLTDIETNAFKGCTGLETLKLNSNTYDIWDSAFEGCTSLKEVVVESDSIGDNVFKGCTALESVTVNSTQIDDSVFEGCTSLKEAVVESDSIGDNVFKGCTALESVTINSTEIGNSMFKNCTRLKNVTMGKNVKSIGSNAFENCTSLDEITIPSTVTDLGYECFIDSGLVTANIDCSGKIRDFSFNNCDLLKTVVIGDSVTEIGNDAFSSCTSLESVEFGDSVKKIGTCAFFGCAALERVVIGESVTEIGSEAFSHCNSLANVVLGNSVTIIRERAFAGCYSLQDFVIPDSVKTLEGEIFAMASMGTIEIGSGLSKINDYTFFDYWVTEFIVDEDNKYFSNDEHGVLFNKDKTTLVRYPSNRDAGIYEIPYGVTEIKAFAFDEGMPEILLMPDTVKTIGWYGVGPVSDVYYNGVKEQWDEIDIHEQGVYDDFTNFHYLHTATFVVADENGTYEYDGSNYRIVEKVVFREGAEKINTPDVPQIDGYIGSWEEFTVEDKDIVVKAKYELKSTDNESTLEESKTVDYENGVAQITLSAFAETLNAKVDMGATPYDIVLVLDQSSSMTSSMGSQTRLDVLKDVATDFVGNIYDSATEYHVEHRIAIVGFSGAGSSYKATGLLTPSGSLVNFKNLNASAYSKAFVSVTDNKNLLDNAIANITTGQGTSADLGLEMASNIFANTEPEDGRKRLVIFITDGVPTTSRTFDSEIANNAINNAYEIKNIHNAAIYSVGVSTGSDPTDETEDMNNFLHCVSSNYPQAKSLSNKGTSAQMKNYFVSAEDADTLSEIFDAVVAQNITNTISFNKVSFYDTVSKYFTLTTEQEDALRKSLKDEYGIEDQDITITRNTDGTTYIKIDNLSPKAVYDENNVMSGYEVKVVFEVSANENALEAGIYKTNTEDAGIEHSDKTVAEFEVPSINITSDRNIIVFEIDGEVYSIQEVEMGDKVVAPETELANWNISEDCVVTESYTVFTAELEGEQRTVTWYIGDEVITEIYVVGSRITPPEVVAPEGYIFSGWNITVPYKMPDSNLEIIATFETHTHEFTKTTSGSCDTGLENIYTCTCGYSYSEKSEATDHTLTAKITQSVEDSVASLTCSVCGYHEEKVITYQAVYNSSGENKNGGFNRPSNNTVTNVIDLEMFNADEVSVQPEGQIVVKLPMTTAMKNAQNLEIYRLEENNVKTEIEFEIDGDYLVLYLDHFSYYVITSEEYSDDAPTYDDVLTAFDVQQTSGGIASQVTLLRGTASMKTYKDTEYVALTMNEAKTSVGIYTEMADGGTVELTDINGTIQNLGDRYVAYQSQNKTNPVATMKVTYADGTVETYPVVFELYEIEREISFNPTEKIKPIRGKISKGEDAKGEYILVEMLEGQSSVGVYKTSLDSTTATLLDAEGMFTEKENLYIFYGSQNTTNPEGRLTVTEADGSQKTYRIVFKLYEMDPYVNAAKGLRPVRGAVTFDADGTIRIKMTKGQTSVGLYKTMANGATYEIVDENGRITNNPSSLMFYMSRNTANVTAKIIFTLPDGTTKEQKIIFDMGLADNPDPLVYLSAVRGTVSYQNDGTEDYIEVKASEGSSGVGLYKDCLVKYTITDVDGIMTENDTRYYIYKSQNPEVVTANINFLQSDGSYKTYKVKFVF